MMREDIVVPRTEADERDSRRISWGAVFAGVVAALVIQLVLSVLGVSIGAATINPLTEAAPASGIPLGAGIWFALTTLISLFFGGWVAGHMAGVTQRLDGALHGLLSWGLATLVMTYLVTSTVGGLIGGATNILGKGISAVGGGAAELTQIAVRRGTEELQKQGIGFDDVKREALSLLRDTGKEELSPATLGAAGERLGKEVGKTAEHAAKEPTTASQDISDLLDRIRERGGKALDAADREAAINVMVKRTNMTRAEADKTIDEWQTMYQKAQARYQELRVQAEQQARIAGDKAARGTAQAAGWSTFAMILGGIAAAFGGLFGTARHFRLDRHGIGFTHRDVRETRRDATEPKGENV